MAGCRLCGGGKAKRQCPAVGGGICPSCCGTKRQVEIRCPPECGWLQSARAHPHAAQQRQQERDASLIVPLIRGLDEGPYGALITCLQAALAARATLTPVPLDVDLLEAVRAVAATAETSLRGVLYEHVPESPVAARLSRAISAPLREASERGVPQVEASVAEAMRRVDEVLQAFLKTAPDAPDAFFAFLERVLKPHLADATTGRALAASDPLLAPLAGGLPDDGPRIIVP